MSVLPSNHATRKEEQLKKSAFFGIAQMKNQQSTKSKSTRVEEIRMLLHSNMNILQLISCLFKEQNAAIMH